jgi:hypothetical protein
MAGTSPNQVSSASQFALSQLPAGLQAKDMDTFTYNVEILPTTASGSTTGTITINNDADFLLISLAGVVTTTNDATQITYVPATILFTDTGSGRAISNTPVAWNNAVGTAQEPVYLDYPKFLARSTGISIQYNALEATQRNVRIALRGFKIFNYLRNT